jgi:hypothetical protein
LSQLAWDLGARAGRVRACSPRSDQRPWLRVEEARKPPFPENDAELPETPRDPPNVYREALTLAKEGGVLERPGAPSVAQCFDVASAVRAVEALEICATAVRAAVSRATRTST